MPKPHATSSPAGRVLRPGAKVLPEHARSHNRSLVLQTLFSGGAMSRADLARETGLTRVTISDLVAGLIADGYITEIGMREASGPGKPAMLVDLDRAGHRIIGIDLSGTDALVGAVLTLDGVVVARRELPLPADDLTDAVVALARELVADSHAPVLGIGVGTPGVVDDRGHPVVGGDFQELGLELVSGADVHGDDLIVGADFLEEQRHLVAIGGGPIVQAIHGLSFTSPAIAGRAFVPNSF